MSERHRRFLSTAMMTVLILVTAVGFAGGAEKVFFLLGSFEADDGNAYTDNPNPGVPDDWDRVYNGTDNSILSVGVIPDPPGTTIFQTGGSKDINDISDWRWTDGNVPDKTEILNAYAALYEGGVFAFGADRYSIDGDAQIGFWLLQGNVGLNPNGTFKGTHEIGDILVLSHFTNGGGLSTIEVYRWVGPGGSEASLDLIAVTPAQAVAVVNAQDEPSPWPYVPKSGTSGTFPTGAFFEGAVDLGAIGVTGCFNAFIAETRSSQELNAQLKDFIFGSFDAIPQVTVDDEDICEGGEGELCAEATGGVPPYSYEWSTGGNTECITVTEEGTYWVLVTGANGCVSDTAYADVIVHPLPIVTISGDDPTCPEGTQTHCGPDDMVSYTWEISGDGVIVGAPMLGAVGGLENRGRFAELQDGQCVEVLAGAQCGTSYTLTLTIVDEFGCENTDSRTFTVNDTENPAITTCPPTAEYECDESWTFPSDDWAGFVGAGGSATDNCDSQLEAGYTMSGPTGSCPTEWTLTWTVTDNCGNTDTCDQIIREDDTTGPEITTCPPEVTYECDEDWTFPGNNWAGFVQAGGAATDNCSSVLTASYTVSGPVGDCPKVWTLTWAVVDECGNESTCDQFIKEDDTTAPEITSCPEEQTHECGTGWTFPNNDWAGFVGAGGAATDNCDDNLTASYEMTGPVGNCPKVWTLTWIVEDECENGATCEQLIKEDDTVDPEITTCPPEITYECSDDWDFPTNDWAGFVAAGGAASDDCDEDLTAGYEMTGPVGECPKVWTLTWTVEDDCENSATCDQLIKEDDTSAPEITTCPPEVTHECDEDWSFPTNDWAGFVEMGGVATDNCDTELSATYEMTGPVGECPKVWTLTWTVMDDCENGSSCDQLIKEDDTTAPEITTCPPEVTYECTDEWDFPTNDWAGFTEAGGAATDNCDDELTASYEMTGPVGECPKVWTLTWTVEDDCENGSSCDQLIKEDDTEPPVLTCAPDDTISCWEEVVFTDPTAEDLCDPDPEITVTGEGTEEGPNPGEVVHFKCWVAADYCGNESDECCQRITVLPCGCTYTQGGYGSGCPESHWDRPYSTQPGCIRDNWFDEDMFECFPNGLMIGIPPNAASDIVLSDGMGTEGALVQTHYAIWYTAEAVEAFLPAGGTPGVLTSTPPPNPTETSAGVLAGQLVALKLNREFSCKGVFAHLGLVPQGDCLGNLPIPASCGKFAGLTVDQFIGLADQAVGGNTFVLESYDASMSDVNWTATCLNEMFDDCRVEFPQGGYDVSFGAQTVEIGTLVDDSSPQPREFTVGQSYPNPFSPATTIRFGLPADGVVTIQVFDVAGRMVRTLLDERKPAGFHTVAWYGRDDSGERVAPGVYLYRAQFNDKALIRKMILIQ